MIPACQQVATVYCMRAIQDPPVNSLRASQSVTLLLMSKPRPEPTTRFGRYLRDLMDAHGFQSDADLGTRAGLNASLLSKWQYGKAEPTMGSLRKVAPHLGVRLGDLLVEAELATPAELGMRGEPRPPAPKLDPLLADAASLLADENVPAEMKAIIRREIKSALKLWDDFQRAMADQREPERPPPASRSTRTVHRKG